MAEASPAAPSNAAQNGATSEARTSREGFRGSRRGGGPRGDRSRGSNTRTRGQGQNTQPRRNQPQLDGAVAPPPPPPKNPAVLQTDGIVKEANPDEGDVEAEVCFICASNVIHNAIAPCNHRTCHICALRMRALYKTKACAHCRTNADSIVFTDNATKRYEDFTRDDFFKIDDTLGIKYESNDIFDDTLLLLRYNCPDPSCEVAAYGWPDLHKHVKTVHHKAMCDLCTRNKKVFTHEHELFTPTELRRHEKSGDDNPGAVDQSGFKGHPECGFCRQRFYSDDELYTHCRDKHERCHICDRRGNNTGQQQYYLDYNALEIHFSKDHFLCADQECLEKKFVVFDSEMDLKAHQLEVHPNGLSKDARRDARRVDLSGFDYRTPHQEPRGGRREGRNRGRGRDPNTEPLPASSAQPLRRDEIAFQRQLAVHSAQSVSTRTFGGQLTSSGAYAARPAANTAEPATVSAPRQGGPSLADSHIPDSEERDPATVNIQSLPPSERARALRHASLNERASNLLKRDATKLATFRTKVSSYRNDHLSAASLIDNFFGLFDCSSSELGTLIKELADIFEIPGKRDDLLIAWNDWRAINEDYPSLPGPNGIAPGADAITSGGGKRILKLKSSTAQSSRSAVSKSSSWGTANGGGSSSRSLASANNPFPPMPTSNKSASVKASATPWVNSASASPAITQRNTPTVSRPVSRGPQQGYNSSALATDSFPALPMGQKLGMNISRPGYLGNPVRRNIGSGTNTPSNAWTGGNNAMDNLSAALEVVDTNGDGTDAKGKGKGKKKQTLIHWG